MASEKHTRVGVGVFVFRSPEDTRFLLGARKGSIGADTWSLAGGHLEYGESFEECAAREVLEETGVEIEDVQFLTAIESLFETEEKHYVTIFMTAYAMQKEEGRAPTPQVMEPDKCEEWTWVSYVQMRALENVQSGSLFLPIRNLMAQRPGICATLESGKIPGLTNI